MEKKEVELPDDIPEIFNAYLHCVYKDKVDIGDLSIAIHPEDESRSEATKINCRLVLTYVLADKLADVIASNMIIDEIARYSDRVGKVPSSDALKATLSNTLEGSAIQRLLLDYYVHEANALSMETICTKEFVPGEFLHRILKEKARLEDTHRKGKICEVFQVGYVMKHLCHYHQHDEEHPSCGENCVKGMPE